MRGDLYTGWFKLAGDFPPSVNTNDNPKILKPYESPECYGVDITQSGNMASGSIPTGTARTATTKIGGSYYWYYDRLWAGSGTTLTYGAWGYDDVYIPQALGKIFSMATIVTYMPALNDQMWICTATGSQLFSVSKSGVNPAGKFIQELSTSSASLALTLDGNPVVADSYGVYMFDGNSLKNLTLNVRKSLGSFGDASAITADYDDKYIIGTSKFAVDVKSGKLFDYGTSGFRFTSRTLSGENNRPFGIGDIGLAYYVSSDDPGDVSISWQTKVEDEDWFDEQDLFIPYTDGNKSFFVTRSQNPYTSAHKFALRITAMDSRMHIEEIDLSVTGLATGSFGA